MADLDTTAEILSTLSSYNRIYTFTHIEEKEPREIAQELEVTRNALQPYITDWKELDLVQVENGEYYYTERGEAVRESILGFL